MSIQTVAVIGSGFMGSGIAQVCAQSGFRVCLVDIDEQQAEKTGAKLQCPALNDYRRLPALGVRCASVAASTTSHYEIARWLLEHGVDVLLEKPMTVTLEEAETLVKLAEREGRILQVGHLERFNPAFQEMKKALTEPRFFEVRRISPFRGRGHDVDVVLDLMIHDIDIVAHLVSRPLLHLEAVGVPVLRHSTDIANVRLTFEGGAVANVTASRAAYKPERTIRIFQPDVYIFADYQQKILKIYSRTSSVQSDGLPEIRIESFRIEERDALADEIESFLGCVNSRARPVVSGEEGMNALKLATTINDKIREGLLQFERR